MNERLVVVVLGSLCEHEHGGDWQVVASGELLVKNNRAVCVGEGGGSLIIRTKL